MIKQELKDRVFDVLINCQISTYTALYAPDEAVVTISNIVALIGNESKYAVRNCLKSLMNDGLICRKSQGCPAIVSYGEVPELVCDAMPPINGYCLTEKGYLTSEWKNAYRAWERSMEEWANGYVGDAGAKEDEDA